MTVTPIPPTQSNMPPYPPRRRKGLNPWLIRLPVLLITGSILLLVVLGIFLFAFQLRYTDVIYPGVSAMGVPLDGLSPQEAVAALDNGFTYDRDTIFTLRDGDKFWQLTAGELGVSFDLESTVEVAYAVGRQENFASGLVDQASTWFTGSSIAPRVRYEQQVALNRLNEIAAEVNRQPVDATLVLEGVNVITTPSQTGRTLDVAATLAQLEQQILLLESGTEIALIVHETPPLVWNVEESANRARIALSGAVTLTATDDNGQQLGPWTATVEQIATLLQVNLLDNGDGTRSYDVRINMDSFGSYLEQLAPGLIVMPQDGRFRFDEQTRELEVIEPSVSGRTLNVAQTLERLEEGVFTADNRVVPMAFDFTLPRYHNQITAAELGITSLVSESTTYFTGSSANRRTNIAVAASRFDGLIIAPGEEFSFNYWLGELSTDTGFVEGKVIFGGRTVTGLGGGVCQVSTTAFRAAINGGFPVTERNSHGYRVGYYELNGFAPGLDAAIWTPDRDFRFQNDTDYHLLIETSFLPTENALQFRYYSTNPGRVVEIEEAIVKNTVPAPATKYEANSEIQPGDALRVDYAAEGADVTVYVNIYDLQGNLIRQDPYFTHYLPWQEIIQVNPNDSRLRFNS